MPHLHHNLRVIQYNIHRFLDKSGSSTLSHISHALESLSPDVLTLNEMDITTTPTAFEHLSNTLNLPHVEFFGHVKERYGNAILSKYPLTRTLSTHLRGGTELEFPPGTLKLNGDISKLGEKHRIVRGLVVVEMNHPVAGKILIGCTHLDHIDIEQRKVQLQHIVESFQASDDRPAILCGDFNALRRNDYSGKQWKALEDRARENKWSPPSFGDLDMLISSGFVDSGLVESGGESGASNESKFTAPTEEDSMYRIDYCFLKSNSDVDILPLKCYPDTTIALSDHYPLVVDLELTCKGGTRNKL